MLASLLGVAVGGVLGAIARFHLGRVIMKRWPGTFPLGTFLINLSGSFLLCLLAAWPGWATLPPYLRDGVSVGFLGAYTTFSTFAYETIKLCEDGEFPHAGAYLGGSLLLGLAAGWLGFLTGSHL